MPIDPNIALGVKPVQIDSPVNALARVLQVQGLQQQQEAGALDMDLKRRSVERANALDRILGAGGGAPELRRGGFLKESMDLEKSGSENAERAAKTTKEMVDAQHKVIGLYRDAVNGVQDAQSAAEFLATMHTDPRLKDSPIARVPLEKVIAQIPQDPAQLAAWKQQFALGAAKFMELNKPTITTRNLGGTTDTITTEGLTGKTQAVNSVKNTQSPDNAATNARLAADNAASRAQSERHFQEGQNTPQYMDTEGGIVALPKKLAAGQQPTATPVLGADGKPLTKPAKALTDAQAKANLFGTRMRESDRILTALEGKYMPGAVNAKMAAGEVPGVGGALGYAGNMMLSESGQQAEQAQRDFVNAVLRRESGAVISPSEFSNAQKQYFPQPGDDKNTLAQKRANRALAIKGLEVEVPGGFRGAPSLTSPGNTGSASGGWDASAIDAELKRRGVKP